MSTQIMKKSKKKLLLRAGKDLHHLVGWVFGGTLSLPKVVPEASMPLPDKFDAGYDLTAKDITELNAKLKKLEGTQFQNPRSSSSAIDPIETQRFGPIKIEYIAGKGTRGFYVGGKGYYGNETEIVIGNKNIMTIIGARVVNGVPYFVIRVDGIPDFPD